MNGPSLAGEDECTPPSYVTSTLFWTLFSRISQRQGKGLECPLERNLIGNRRLSFPPNTPLFLTIHKRLTLGRCAIDSVG